MSIFFDDEFTIIQDGSNIVLDITSGERFTWVSSNTNVRAVIGTTERFLLGGPSSEFIDLNFLKSTIPSPGITLPIYIDSILDLVNNSMVGVTATVIIDNFPAVIGVTSALPLEIFGGITATIEDPITVNGIVGVTAVGLLGVTNSTIEGLPVRLNQQGGDLGQIRVRIDRGDPGLDTYSIQSIVMDGGDDNSSNSPATTTLRTAGLPNSGRTGGIDRITFPVVGTGGQALFFASSSNSDVGVTGTGARTIFIQALNSDWDRVTDTITMNGQIGVTSNLTNLIRLNRIFVSTVGSFPANVGDLFCSTTNSFTSGVPDVDIVSVIQMEYGASAVGIISVPRFHRLYFTRGSYYTSATQNRILINRQESTFPFGGSGAPDINRIRLLVGGLYTSQTSHFNTSGSVPESPATDVEFFIASQFSTVNYSIFWNTVLVQTENL